MLGIRNILEGKAWNLLEHWDMLWDFAIDMQGPYPPGPRRASNTKEKDLLVHLSLSLGLLDICYSYAGFGFVPVNAEESIFCFSSQVESIPH